VVHRVPLRTELPSGFTQDVTTGATRTREVANLPGNRIRRY
jgi:hypothetical protein